MDSQGCDMLRRFSSIEDFKMSDIQGLEKAQQLFYHVPVTCLRMLLTQAPHQDASHV